MFFANRNTQKNMQLLDKIHTVFTAALRVLVSHNLLPWVTSTWGFLPINGFDLTACLELDLFCFYFYFLFFIPDLPGW